MKFKEANNRIWNLVRSHSYSLTRELKHSTCNEDVQVWKLTWEAWGTDEGTEGSRSISSSAAEDLVAQLEALHSARQEKQEVENKKRYSEDFIAY